MKEFEYRGRPHGRIDMKIASSLWEQGYTDSEIGDVCSVAKNTVAVWRRRNGLKPNAKSPAQKEEARSIAAINAEAREHGMSYGKHTAAPVIVRGHRS